MNQPPSRPPSDAGIPILTEVLPSSPFPATGEAADLIHAWPVADTVNAVSIVPATHEQWQQHAQDIEEHVMQQLLGQVNNLLRQQIAEQMAIAFEQITEQLTARIQQNLELALRLSVQLAVAQEIEKSKLLKNKGL